LVTRLWGWRAQIDVSRLTSASMTLEGVGASARRRTKNNKPREASMPKPVPNTQTGSLTDNQHGTNDTLILDPGTGPFEPPRILFGDALAMLDDSRGGNDTLIGGDTANNFLVGDAD
jgi:hypothetical protein